MKISLLILDDLLSVPPAKHPQELPANNTGATFRNAFGVYCGMIKVINAQGRMDWFDLILPVLEGVSTSHVALAAAGDHYIGKSETHDFPEQSECAFLDALSLPQPHFYSANWQAPTVFAQLAHYSFPVQGFVVPTENLRDLCKHFSGLKLTWGSFGLALAAACSTSTGQRVFSGVHIKTETEPNSALSYDGTVREKTEHRAWQQTAKRLNSLSLQQNELEKWLLNFACHKVYLQEGRSGSRQDGTYAFKNSQAGKVTSLSLLAAGMHRRVLDMKGTGRILGHLLRRLWLDAEEFDGNLALVLEGLKELCDAGVISLSKV